MKQQIETITIEALAAELGVSPETVLRRAWKTGVLFQFSAEDAAKIRLTPARGPKGNGTAAERLARIHASRKRSKEKRHKAKDM